MLFQITKWTEWCENGIKKNCIITDWCMSGCNRWIMKDMVSGEQTAFYFISCLHHVYLVLQIKCLYATLIGSKLTLFKGNELYLRIVKWQQKLYTAGNLYSLLDLLQACGQQCCSLWFCMAIIDFTCNYHHHSELCGFRLWIHKEIPSIINKRKTKISLTAIKSVTRSLRTLIFFE